MLLWLLGDRRLLGRWQSDAERTLAEWQFQPDTSEEARATTRNLFGKLELTYSRWRCDSLFEGTRSTGWYRVLATDSESVMIVSLTRMPVVGWSRTLYHIHFDVESYWIKLGRSNQREFFRRVGT